MANYLAVTKYTFYYSLFHLGKELKTPLSKTELKYKKFTFVIEYPLFLSKTARVTVHFFILFSLHLTRFSRVVCHMRKTELNIRWRQYLETPWYQTRSAADFAMRRMWKLFKHEVKAGTQPFDDTTQLPFVFKKLCTRLILINYYVISLPAKRWIDLC